MRYTESNMVIPIACIIAFRGKSVLLVQHGKFSAGTAGGWSLPVGRLHKREEPEHAALREFAEQTGMAAPADKLQKMPIRHRAFLDSPSGQHEFSMQSYACVDPSGSMAHASPFAPAWIPLAGLEDLPLLPNTAKAVREAHNYLEGKFTIESV